MQAQPAKDPHTQLRSLYHSLLTSQEKFDEFKQLLAQYPIPESDQEQEPTGGAELRRVLNARIRDWVGGSFDGLTATQVAQWRAIIVDERFNVALSPWKESNGY